MRRTEPVSANSVQYSDLIVTNYLESVKRTDDNILSIASKNIGTDYTYKHEIVWKNVVGSVIFHILAIWGWIVITTGGIGLKTFIWCMLIIYTSGEGVTIGAHRLYSHKSFRATPFLRAMLMMLQTVAGQPVENWFVSFINLGEGWHNYHHAFPWDYKTAELTMHFNITASIIRFCESVGLAYDLKSASPEMVEKRIKRTGDGTHYELGNDEARASITAIGPLHPLNPSYNSRQRVPEAVIPSEGLPLFHEKDILNSGLHEKRF